MKRKKMNQQINLKSILYQISNINNSEVDSEKKNLNIKRNHYLPRNPLYYYLLEGNNFKNICRNKFRKYTLDFRCLNT